MRLPDLISNKGLFILSLSCLMMIWSCANIVAPTGGPKDIDPPKVISTEPDNFSVNFKSNTIRFYFNEYVQLKDERRVILISPPPDELPEAKIKGKSVILTIPGKLKDSTTYSIQFGTAIQDFNEGNPLLNYSYVFSTGNTIDTLSLNGTVYKAENLTVMPKIMVFLYSSMDDSTIYKEKPYFVTRTDDNGSFRFEHLAQGSYTLIALKDDNTDLLVSLPAEEIAFVDSLVRPAWYPSLSDSLKKDTILTQKTGPESYSLYLFKEKDTAFRFLKAYLERPWQLVLPFSLPVTDIELQPIGSSSGLKDWYIPEWSKEQDTLYCWIKPDLIADSLILSLKAGKSIRDTIRLDLNRFGKGGKYRRNVEKPEKLPAIPGMQASISPEEIINLTFKYPVTEAGLQDIKLITPKDTVATAMMFTDSMKRHLALSYPWEENTAYQLVIPKGILRDWSGQINDSLVYKFATRPYQDYGNLNFAFQPSESGQYILQLLDAKDKVVKEKVISSTATWNLNYLNPGKYKIKVIRDKNNNSHWDSGNYRLKIQPEKVSFYPKTLEIRGNWDLEESWKW